MNQRQNRLALRLENGRKNPAETMSDWGFSGPTLSIDWFHWTYNATLRIGFADGSEQDLSLVNDLIEYQGNYYGDFDIMSSEEATTRGFLPHRPGGGR